MAKEGMIFYSSFHEALRELPAEQYKECMEAILNYGIDGNEPDVEGLAKVIFTLIKPQIDANNKRAENGAKGGRPRAEKPLVSENAKTEKPLVIENTETQKPKEKEKVKEKVKEKDINNTMSGSRAETRLEIIKYLNAKTGKDFRHSSQATVRLIEARLNEGYQVEDFKKVIDNKVMEWKGTEQEQYLRPETLFSPSHFESYLNQRQFRKRPSGNMLSTEMTHSYDMEELRRRAKA